MINKEPFVLIENYPVSKETDIPYEARASMIQRIKRLNKYEKRLQDLALEREIEFEEEMEVLDQYN